MTADYCLKNASKKTVEKHLQVLKQKIYEPKILYSANISHIIKGGKGIFVHTKTERIHQQETHTTEMLNEILRQKESNSI